MLRGALSALPLIVYFCASLAKYIAQLPKLGMLPTESVIVPPNKDRALSKIVDRIKLIFDIIFLLARLTNVFYLFRLNPIKFHY